MADVNARGVPYLVLVDLGIAKQHPAQSYAIAMAVSNPQILSQDDDLEAKHEDPTRKSMNADTMASGWEKEPDLDQIFFLETNKFAGMIVSSLSRDDCLEKLKAMPFQDRLLKTIIRRMAPECGFAPITVGQALEYYKQNRV